MLCPRILWIRAEHFLKKTLRPRRLPLCDEHLRNAQARLHPVRAVFQRLRKLRKRFAGLAIAHEECPEILMQFGVPRSQHQHPHEVRDGLGNRSAAERLVCSAHLIFEERTPNPHGFGKMVPGFIPTSLRPQHRAEIEMSEMVFIGDDEGMCEDALAGSPGLHLCAGHGCEEEDERSRERSGSTRCQLATVAGPFRKLPDDRDENPDERKVRIAVSHRLSPT